MLIGETFWVLTLPRGTSEGRNRYYYKEIMATKVLKNGDLAWMKMISVYVGCVGGRRSLLLSGVVTVDTALSPSVHRPCFGFPSRLGNIASFTTLLKKH